MDAVFSDVHSNLEAFTSVLDEIARQSVARVFHLGDTVGYGPNPLECLDLSMRLPLVLNGNFDHAVRHIPFGFSVGAENSIFWTQAMLMAEPNSGSRARREAFLASLSGSHRANNILYVHASARDPVNEYLFPEDIYNEEKMARIGALFDRICFAGHTHQPGTFLERGPGRWEFIEPAECNDGFPVAGCKLICNVGSVGQPRDGDWRECYVLFDGDRIWFRRVEYDVETTVQKIYAVPELLDFLGDRLREGAKGVANAGDRRSPSIADKKSSLQA